MLSRTLLALLLIQLLQPVGLAQQRLQVIALQYGKKPDFSFPFVKPSGAATYKINKYLQSSILNNDVPLMDVTEMFEKSRYIQKDSNTQFGYYSISYAIERNNASLLSLSFSFEEESATTTYYPGYYNFDSRTGDLLMAEKLFTKTGINEIKKRIVKERSERIGKHLKEWMANHNKEDSTLLTEKFTECNAKADEDIFSIREKSIVFCKVQCFVSNAEPYDLDLDIEMPYVIIEKYLSPYGKQILLQAN